jgi:hypothetical protein
MKKALTFLATAAGIGVAVMIGNNPSSVGNVTPDVARSVIDGVILGANVWPSVPVDIQARLMLRPPNCNEERPCEPLSAVAGEWLGSYDTVSETGENDACPQRYAQLGRSYGPLSERGSDLWEADLACRSCPAGNC